MGLVDEAKQSLKDNIQHISDETRAISTRIAGFMNGTIIPRNMAPSAPPCACRIAIAVFFTAGSPPVTPPLRRASCRPPPPRSPLQGELPKAEGVPPPPHSVRCHGKTPTQDRNAECKTPSQHHLTLW